MLQVIQLNIKDSIICLNIMQKTIFYKRSKYCQNLYKILDIFNYYGNLHQLQCGVTLSQLKWLV